MSVTRIVFQPTKGMPIKQVKSKLRNLDRNHMKDINKFFSSLCDRHCGLSRTFYRTQISLIGLEKQSLLCPLVMKK